MDIFHDRWGCLVEIGGREGGVGIYGFMIYVQSMVDWLDGMDTCKEWRGSSHVVLLLVLLFMLLWGGIKWDWVAAWMDGWMDGWIDG